ncbi:MAG TPA: thiosulfate oxidation carrier complex protein SoxZ [Methylomirabilota bacterium]|jgi:sulfur-oxidizing protein SoxZ|nr:thiosulfate oxidation carrier complex protein SoxZ [Methylomirabilota bacterium]
MPEIGKVRIRVPTNITAGDTVRVRTLVIHPMERVERDKQGQIVRRNYHYINRVEVAYLGKTIIAFDTTQSVSENPSFTFAFKATGPGPLRVTFRDTHGGTYEGTADIRFA